MQPSRNQKTSIGDNNTKKTPSWQQTTQKQTFQNSFKEKVTTALSAMGVSGKNLNKNIDEGARILPTREFEVNRTSILSSESHEK